LELFVRESIGAEEVVLIAGVSRLATHTTVSSGMLLYHMPRYSFAGVEFEGLKKPKTNDPPSEMMVLPGDSGLPETSRSSEVPKGRNRMIRAMVQQATASEDID
jgi:hypothetical protein